VRFSIGLPADERVRAAVLAVAADAWQPATDVDGQPRPGAQVAELHILDLADWPVGTRAICRREDPHPGAQLLWHRNQVWLELVLAAQDLLCWAQALLLDGDLRVAEPRTLRYRLLHVAARVARHARRLIVRLQRTWPWASELAAAFSRLRALPLRC
jgi:hypothetical protein